MPDFLGLYISVPFCRAKCTFCNFASDSFAPSRLPSYLEALAREIDFAPTRAAAIGAHLPTKADTVYLGGGTPSLLSAAQVHSLFRALRNVFDLALDAEITVECAPGQLAPATLEAFQREGVNRLSFGVQSFIDRESAAIGRLHTAAECRTELARVRAAGISSISLDLIAGLPHQTESSWRESLAQALASGVDHLSVYLLEIDEDSRLGRELLSSGARYSAAQVPTDEQAADLYQLACATLDDADLRQYEISNFARPGHRSRHNLKYWRRAPYLGFGLDAHSMLRAAETTAPATDLRFANTDDLEDYLLPRAQASREANSPFTLLPSAPAQPTVTRLTAAAMLEETLFLGLRLNDGLDLEALTRHFTPAALAPLPAILHEAEADGLLARAGDCIRLTPRGRLLSNELFSRFLFAA